MKNTSLIQILKETVIPGGIILNALRGKLANEPKESDLPKELADSKSTAHTLGDDLVQEVALQILHNYGPDFRINAEESTPRVSLFEGDSTSLCYHIDPLDGTLSYLDGKDGYCIGAAFSKRLEFIACVLNFPALDKIFIAQKGKGIRVESSSGKNLGFVRKKPTSNRYIQRRCEELIPVVNRMELKHFDSMGAHHGMLAIATGDAQVLMYRKASPHDFGIPQVLVEEAGGICTDLDGNPLQYDMDFNRIPLFLAFYNEDYRDQFIEVKGDHMNV